MVMPGHVCPYGIKTVALLKRKGYKVIDNHLKTREETDAFKKEYNVETTPQTFVDKERIGGYTEVQSYFGKTLQSEKETSYTPVLTIFAVAGLMALSIFLSVGSQSGLGVIGDFIAISMCILAIQKLQDIESFSTMFLNYDVLAKKWVPYAYLYPFGEAFAGILMLGGLLSFISIPVALFIGSIGAWSVFKAVYLEKRELKCACVGGNSNVPLGFVSLAENIAMVGMAIGMLFIIII